jgi:collagen type VII alpha
MVGFFVDSLSGSKTYAAISKNLRIIESATGTINITAGATVAGIRVDIVNKYAAGITLAVTTGAANVTMLLGSLSLEWDGTQWHKIGGMALSLILTTGTAATWITPWAGVYKTTVQGPGAAGAPTGTSTPCAAGGGGGGGCAIAWLDEASGITFTYTVPAVVTSNVTLTDGTRTLTGVKGSSGETQTGGLANGGGGGVPTGGDINIAGQYGGVGIVPILTQGISGSGGGSFLGTGARQFRTAANSNGVAGNIYGGGGSGAVGLSGAVGFSGGAGALGVIIIEF